MLPRIATLLGAEMIRDGGSLSAEFLGANGSEYCLWFALRQERTASGEWVRLGYEPPVVFERLVVRTSTGFGWQPMNEVLLSWQHARVLLNAMRGLARSESDLQWIDQMADVAATSGGLPPTISRRIG